MAEAIDIKITASGDAAQTLSGVRGELQGVEQAATKTEGSWGNLSQQITAGVVAFQAASATIKGMASSLVDAASEIERVSGVLNRFEGDISQAIDRTNGLFTSLELMTSQQKAIQAGLNLTAEEFATLAVAANESASALGTDNVAALDRLVQAMATGRSTGLRAFGIDIRGLTDAAEIQAKVMGELGETYGDVTSQADTVAGRLVNLGNVLEELKIDTIAAINEFKEMNRAIGDIDESLQSLTGTSQEFEPYLRTDVTDSVRFFTAAVSESVETLRDMLEALVQFTEGNWEAGFESLGRAARNNLVRSAREAQAEQAAAERERAAADALAGEDDAATAAAMAEARRQQRNVPRADIGFSDEQAADLRARMGGRGGRRSGSRSGGSSGAADVAANDNGGPLLEGPGGDVGAILGELGGELAAENEANFLRDQNEARREAIELDRVRAQQDRDRADFQREVNAQIEREAALRNQVTNAIIQGGDQLLQAVGASQGQMELWAGASEVAKAIGSYPDPIGIAQHSLAAVLHFKNAAEMGVSGGGDAKASAGRAQGNRNARPQRPGGFGAGGSPGSGAQQTINVNMPFPESQIGRANRYFERQSVRRFGSVRAA